jgi:hypothetical protein
MSDLNLDVKTSTKQAEEYCVMNNATVMVCLFDNHG